MSVIVHNRTEHVEKRRRALRGNIMSCRRRSMVGAVVAPLPPFQIVFQRKITVQRGIQREQTTPIYPLRCLLSLGMLMLVISCIWRLALLTLYIIYVICLV